MRPLEDRLRIEEVEKFQPDAELQTKLDVRGKEMEPRMRSAEVLALCSAARQESRNVHGRVLGINFGRASPLIASLAPPHGLP